MRVEYDELQLPVLGILHGVEFDVEGADWEPYDPGVRYHRDGSGTPPSGGFYEGVTISNVKIDGRPCKYVPLLEKLEEWCMENNDLIDNLIEEKSKSQE